MLRVVVREDLTFEMASDLVKDVKETVNWLDHHFTYTRAPHLHDFASSLFDLGRTTRSCLPACQPSWACLQLPEARRCSPAATLLSSQLPRRNETCQQTREVSLTRPWRAAEEQMNSLRSKFSHHPEHGKKSKRRPGHSKKHFAPC